MKQNHTRRKFLTRLSLGGAAVLANPTVTLAGDYLKFDKPYTVAEVMDMFIRTVPDSPIPNTVDTLKAGNLGTVITGIVTAMFPTVEVIRKTIELGANFIICHEPTFYNHTDDVSWLQSNKVYKYKADLLKKHNITIWRNHDYIHSLVPDGVVTGVVAKLGWTNYAQGNDIYIMPELKLSALINELKLKLQISQVRYNGDFSQNCKKVILRPGAAGGKEQIGVIAQYKPDVLVCGEISEWETAEYVRDARAEGQDVSLVVLGHIASEEAGSVFMAGWLRQYFPGIKTTHVDCGPSLSFA